MRVEVKDLHNKSQYNPLGLDVSQPISAMEYDVDVFIKDTGKNGFNSNGTSYTQKKARGIVYPYIMTDLSSDGLTREVNGCRFVSRDTVLKIGDIVEKGDDKTYWYVNDFKNLKTYGAVLHEMTKTQKPTV